jgi:hypothetical protein
MVDHLSPAKKGLCKTKGKQHQCRNWKRPEQQGSDVVHEYARNDLLHFSFDYNNICHTRQEDFLNGQGHWRPLQVKREVSSRPGIRFEIKGALARKSTFSVY